MHIGVHIIPTPELLDVCDRMGMLVIDENRLMGVSSTHFEYLKRFILRDRNHPSIISWDIGNEEWGIEGNQKVRKDCNNNAGLYANLLIAPGALLQLSAVAGKKEFQRD